MKRSTCVRLLMGLLLAGSLSAVGCKKSEEEPAPVPVPSSTAAATADAPPPATAAATEDPSANPNASGAPTTPQPVVTNTPTRHETIDACCSALAAVSKSGKTAVAKSKAASAAAVCPGIAKLVKAGTTTRAAGLAQIRSALAGFDAPSECR